MSNILILEFDGVIVENTYPEIGEILNEAFETLQEIKRFGYKLILWTCREGENLTKAIEFCKQHGLEFDAINTSLDGSPLKPFGNYFLNENNFGGFPGWDAVKKTLLFQHKAFIRVMPTIQRENCIFHDTHNFGETRKAHKRRLEEGWFDKYAPSDKPGLDIGCQFDPLNNTFRRWDILFGDGDATDLENIPDETYFTVYASNILEHLNKPVRAIKNWFRVLKKGGHLIILVPHRDLYEKKKTLPSQWNPEHKWYWLPTENEEPCTISLQDAIHAAIKDKGEIVKMTTLDEGYDYSLPINAHPVGEFSIEAIIKKN